MEKEVFSELKEVIFNYNSLPEKEKKIVDGKIASIWYKVYDEYATLCEQDKELGAAITEIDRIEDILAYDFSDEFTVYSHTINDFDPECAEDIYKYSNERYNTEKETAENWEKIKAEHLAKIEKINGHKVPFFKKIMLEKVTASLERKERMAKHYNAALARENKRKEYAAKEDQLLKPLKKLVREREKAYAEQVISKHITKNPAIVCVRHTSYISSSAFTHSYDNEPLNSTCNAIRDEVNLHIKEQGPTLNR